MKLIRRTKSRPQQLLDEARGAVKVISKEIKAITKVIKRRDAAKRVPVILAAGGVTAVAVKKLRSSGEPSQPQQATGPRPTGATTPA
jgi:glycerate-2-kinase